MRSQGKTQNRIVLVLGLLASTAILLAAAASASGAGPAWRLESLSNTTAKAGDNDPGTVEHSYYVEATSLGEEAIRTPAEDPGVEPVELSVDLPAGFSAVGIRTNPLGTLSPWDCPGLSEANAFACEYTGGGVPSTYLDAGEARISLVIDVSIDPAASGTKTASFAISGGGAPTSATVDPLRISATPPPFGLEGFDAVAIGSTGQPYLRAGGHPYAIQTDFSFETLTDPNPFKSELWPVEDTRDVVVSAPRGLLGNPTGFDQCTLAQLANTALSQPEPKCPTSSQVGTTLVRFKSTSITAGPLPVFNLVPGSGEPARFGFNVAGTLLLIGTRLRSESDYGVDLIANRIPDALAVAGASVTFWGDPSDPSHDRDHACPGQKAPAASGGSCPPPDQPPFLRMPSECPAPGEGQHWKVAIDSWQNPGRETSRDVPDLSDPNWETRAIQSHKAPGFPSPEEEWGDPQGTAGCDSVPVKGELSARPTALEAETSSGLEVHVEVPNPGLASAGGVASSDIEGVKVTLPQGVTVNPSQAEGLGTCSPARYANSELSFHPDGQHGCPSDSKIGSVEVHTPLLEETIPGSVYIAQPDDPATTTSGAENPFDSLLALYIVLEEPERGVLIKLPGEVRTNETTGRIETEFEDLPQQPFSSFDFKFREGARAPLVTPPTCGTYRTEAVFTPWSNPAQKLTSTSSFQITKGIGGGPCPAGTPGFKPGFSAGSVNNNAGSYSPFNMRLTRSDGEQDMTRFSAVLPPGVLGKLAGLGKCPDSAIALAKSKTGLQERANPSCPASSQIGRSLVGAGVGSVLTHVPGKIYLGGPFHGDPLSAIAITPAVAGPFDVGTVVVREALTLNPKTAEVEVDGAASDPIPHILKGIPVKVRDLRVYVDRPEFILNPTSCDPSSTRAILFGSALDVFSAADDVPVSLSDRFQAASCASLGFKPRLALKLKGGTRRGGHPGLTATYRPRGGNANLKGLTVTLPQSAFLEQAHIRTICTRVQFAADACPKKSIYGRIKAWTPLLDEPLQGPVYLRSSNHKLPDLVFDLHGLVDVEVATRIDSFHGGIRATLEDAPDAPLTKAVLQMQGAKKGLIVNSRNLCASANRASVEFSGQNGKVSDSSPALKPRCRSARGS